MVNQQLVPLCMTHVVAHHVYDYAYRDYIVRLLLLLVHYSVLVVPRVMHALRQPLLLIRCSYINILILHGPGHLQYILVYMVIVYNHVYGCEMHFLCVTSHELLD
jgi:hypothetical protein